jgi:pimeloyl-ACP methyl ester carboxylesterase
LIAPGTCAPSSPVSVEASRGSKLAFWVVNAGMDFVWWAAERLAPSLLIRFLGVPPHQLARASRSDRERVMGVVRSVQPLSSHYAGINVDSTAILRELPLKRIVAPTLVISAQDDLFNIPPVAELAASRIPGAKLIISDTGEHLLIGQGLEAGTAVRAFLSASGLIVPPALSP